MNMETRVYISFALTAVFALLLIWYRSVYACCSVPVIAVLPENAEVGTEVIFSNEGDARELNWSFGDGSPVQKGTKVEHTFMQEGEVMVSADYNNECVAQLSVRVNPKKETGPKRVEPLVNYPQEVRVNETVSFSDQTSGATKWDWSVIGGEKDQVSTNREFTTKFKDPGTYVVSLRVEGDQLQGNRELTVNVMSKEKKAAPAPLEKPLPPPPPAPSRGKGIEFNVSEFMQVCEEYNSSDNATKRKQRDRYAQTIAQHFGRMGTPVTFKGATDLEMKTPDFGSLSRILNMYRVIGVELVPPKGMLDKDGFRQYKTMIITLEEL